MEPYVFLYPEQHIEEIQAAFEKFKSQVELFTEQPGEINQDFIRLIYDLSHVVHHHGFGGEFLEKCFAFLETHPESLSPDTRSSLVQAIIVLHNHKVIDTVDLIDHFVPLFRLNDKNVRRTIYGHFFNRIPYHQTPQIKKELQKYVQHEDPRVSFKTLKLIIDIFHKENKEDPQTINFIARCIDLKNPRLVNAIVSFFLDPYTPKQESLIDEDDLEEMRREAEHQILINGKTKKNKKQLEKIKHMKASIPQDPVQVLGSLDDPLKLTIRLFSLLSQPEHVKIFKTRETQLRAMELISKLIFQFSLDFDKFFTWSERFIRPNYEDITKLLSIVASAVHSTTNVDTVAEVCRTIANNFVVDHLDEEVQIVGMNTIREICARNPHGMTPELLEDLTAYKKSDRKGVVMAARGIIQVFRENRPDILPKRERGKPTDDAEEPLAFGEQRSSNVLGELGEIAMTRLLTDEEIEKIKKGKADEIGDDDNNPDDSIIDETTLTEGSRVHKRTKEEMVAAAKEGKPEKHSFHNKKEDKTAGFSNKDKLKFKPFMLTRFRQESGRIKNKNLSAVQKDKKKREGKLKTLKMR